MPTDAELLRRYAAGHAEDAFAELVRRHVGLVYLSALRQVGGDTHAAEEIAQSVFTDLARKAGAISQREVLVSWLHTSTRFAAAKARRTLARRLKHESAARTMNVLNTETASAPDNWERLRPLLDEVVHELGERDRAVVLLRFFAGRPFAEIGAACGLSDDAARMRVERALEKLRARLARRGVTSTGAALGLLLANEAASAVPAGMAASVAAHAVAAAVAGGTTSLAGAALVFMSSTKTVVGIAALAVLGVGGAVYESRVAARSVAETAALRSEHAALRAKAAALETRLQAAERPALAAADRARTNPASPELPSAKNGPAAVETKPAAGGEGLGRGPWNKPDFARLELEKFRAGLALRYGALYRALALNPEQIAKFESALIEMQQGVTDVWTAAEAQGISAGAELPANTAVARMTSDPIKRAQAKLEELLGKGGYETYKDFSESETAREFVSTLAGAVYGTDAPLTGVQGEALARLLKANTKIVRTRMADDGDRPLYALAEVTDWKAAQEQAGAVLAPAQLTAFRALVERARIEREQERIAQGAEPAAVPQK